MPGLSRLISRSGFILCPLTTDRKETSDDEKMVLDTMYADGPGGGAGPGAGAAGFP